MTEKTYQLSISYLPNQNKYSLVAVCCRYARHDYLAVVAPATSS